MIQKELEVESHMETMTLGRGHTENAAEILDII
jgi:hypothetical protein